MRITRSLPLVVGSVAALVAPTAVLAATGSPPPDDASLVATITPWVMGSIAVALGALAALRPWTRRWIVAGAILIAGGMAAFYVLLAGTVGGWSGRPSEWWTVPGAVIAGLVGLSGAAWILRGGVRPDFFSRTRRRPAQPFEHVDSLANTDGLKEP